MPCGKPSKPILKQIHKKAEHLKKIPSNSIITCQNRECFKKRTRLCGDFNARRYTYTVRKADKSSSRLIITLICSYTRMIRQRSKSTKGVLMMIHRLASNHLQNFLHECSSSYQSNSCSKRFLSSESYQYSLSNITHKSNIWSRLLGVKISASGCHLLKFW